MLRSVHNKLLWGLGQGEFRVVASERAGYAVHECVQRDIVQDELELGSLSFNQVSSHVVS